MILLYAMIIYGPEYDRPGIIYGPEYDRPGIIYGSEYGQPGIIIFFNIYFFNFQTKIFKY